MKGNSMSAEANVGVVGLAAMGGSLARNLAHHGNKVAVFNRTYARTEKLMNEHGTEGEFFPAKTLEEFVDSLAKPRTAIIMVKAGEPTYAMINALADLMEPGDIIVDAGNAYFPDTIRREKEISARGLHFVGCGVSGGEEGALLGPSMMPGGSEESWKTLRPIFESIAAKAEGEPCVTHIGLNGAGHFVKMVHNGIEYSDMQLIAESYDLMRRGLGMTPAEIGDVFEEWNKTELDSYLIEITAEVLHQVDKKTGKPLVDLIVDHAGMKGTGTWTVQTALSLAVPVTGIAEAVFARGLSSEADLREEAQKQGFAGPDGKLNLNDDEKKAFIEDIRQALYASKIVAYAQGFNEITTAAKEYGWDIDLAAVHLAWRLHHPREVPQPHFRSVRIRRGQRVTAVRPVLQERHRKRREVLAQRGRPGRHQRSADPGVRLVAVLLRRPAFQASAGRPHPGPARLLRRPHLPARGPAGRVPHPVGRAGPRRDRSLIFSLPLCQGGYARGLAMCSIARPLAYAYY